MSDYQRGYADAVNDIRGDITAMRDNCASQRGRLSRLLTDGGLPPADAAEASASISRYERREGELSAALRRIETASQSAGDAQRPLGEGAGDG